MIPQMAEAFAVREQRVKGFVNQQECGQPDWIRGRSDAGESSWIQLERPPIGAAIAGRAGFFPPHGEKLGIGE